MHAWYTSNSSRKRKSNGIVFNKDGNHLLDKQITRGWEKFLTCSKLRIDQHMLRHNYATLLYKAGVDIKTAQYLLGHKNVKTTLNIYTHIDEELKMNSFGMFNTLLNDMFVDKK